MKIFNKTAKNDQTLLNEIPLEMKRNYAKEFTIDEIENLRDYEQIENERNFVLNKLSCIKNNDLSKLDNLKNDDLKKLQEFLDLYMLGDINYKLKGYYINWQVSLEEVKKAYYMEVQRVTYFDEEGNLIEGKYKQKLTKDNAYYQNKISNEFINYLKKINNLDELPKLPLRIYYDIYNYCINYELAIDFKYILDEKVQFALFLMLLHYPFDTIQKLTGVSKEVMNNLRIFDCFVRKDALESKSLIKERKKKLSFKN